MVPIFGAPENTLLYSQPHQIYSPGPFGSEPASPLNANMSNLLISSFPQDTHIASNTSAPFHTPDEVFFSSEQDTSCYNSSIAYPTIVSLSLVLSIMYTLWQPFAPFSPSDAPFRAFLCRLFHHLYFFLFDVFDLRAFPWTTTESHCICIVYIFFAPDPDFSICCTSFPLPPSSCLLVKVVYSEDIA